jgi:excisionase family DNA binding protein
VGEGRRASGGDQAETDQTTGRSLTVPEAAEVLGISEDAVRSRIKRGTLTTVREGGRVFVVLGATDRATAQTSSATTDQATDERLYLEMQERIRYLERQVDAERQAHAEARRIIAGLVERIPAIEAPSEARESPPSADEEGPSPTPREDRPTPETAASRPWWRRIFSE